MNHVVNSFEGGMNQTTDGSKIPPGQYFLLVNGRVRDNLVTPIHRPVLLGENDGVPNAINAQGIYSLGAQTLVFLDGQAYFRNDADVIPKFTQVVEFLMDVNVPFIYACAVPSSKINFKRSLASIAIDGTGLVQGGVNLTGNVQVYPAAVLCQDGINRPVVLGDNLQSRVAQDYNAWTPDQPEYVPIGSLMLYSGAILYLLSPEGKQIYRSVSGRPFDFMVVIDSNGNRLANEQIGGAATVSHSVSYAALVALQDMNTPNNDFYVSTIAASYFVTPDLENTLFGEPRFTDKFKADSGAINNNAFIQVIGDQIFVNKQGIRSFNAAQNTQESGKFLPFSSRIHNLFERADQELITQDIVSAIKFNSYATFQLKTRFGYGVLIYDEVNGIFVSLDIYKNIEPIKMFSEINTVAKRKLMFITNDGKVYEQYGEGEAALENELCQVYIGDFLAPLQEDGAVITEKSYQKIIRCVAEFTNVLEDGIVYCTTYTDGKMGSRVPVYIAHDHDPIPEVSQIPVFNPTKKKIATATFKFPEEIVGSKVAVMLEWKFDASLMSCLIETNDGNQSVSQEQRVALTEASITGMPSIVSQSTNSATVTQDIILKGTKLDKVTAIFLGVTECQILAKSKTELTFLVPVLDAEDYDILVVSNNSMLNVGTLTVTI